MQRLTQDDEDFGFLARALKKTESDQLFVRSAQGKLSGKVLEPTLLPLKFSSPGAKQ